MCVLSIEANLSGCELWHWNVSEVTVWRGRIIYIYIYVFFLFIFFFFFFSLRHASGRPSWCCSLSFYSLNDTSLCEPGEKTPHPTDILTSVVSPNPSVADLDPSGLLDAQLKEAFLKKCSICCLYQLDGKSVDKTLSRTLSWLF